MEEYDLEKFLSKCKEKSEASDLRLRREERSEHTNDMIKNLHCINDEVSFQAFASVLFSKLDEINTMVVEQHKMLQEHGDKLEAQSRQIAKMNEAFDMIMDDYFKEVMEGVKEFGQYMKRITQSGGRELETDEGREMLLTRIELLKGRADLVEDTTVSFSSENMQKIYRAIMPDIKKEIDSLYAKINNDLHGMHTATTNNIVNNTTLVMKSIANHHDNLEVQARNLMVRIGESEKAIKMAAPGNINSYRN